MNDITCIEFRQRVGAEPASRDAALARHRLACPACAAHARGLEAFDRRLAQALALPVPPELAHRVILRASSEEARAPRRWLGLAAALGVLAVGAVAYLATQMRPAPDATLVADLLAHLEHEPDTLVPTAVTVAHARVLEALDRTGSPLAAPEALGTVSFARTCPFRGRLVPHLVFQGARGPVTVFLLRDERVTRPTPFDEGGYRGVILPAGDYAIAVLGSDAASVAAVQGRVVRAVGVSI